MLLVYFALFLYIFRLSLELSGPIIQTPLGKVLGWERRTRGGRMYQAFTSVPFAQPPVGKLRFKAPLPPKRWEGVYDATQDMPYCTQYYPIVTQLSDAPRSAQEDCLYLNVYKPKKSTNRSMPVIAYIFAGANRVGYVGARWNADYIMDEDVVLVEPNFRVGALGLLSLGDNFIPGNYMYKDQVQALRWIKQNIASFDGNPNQIIVMGGSSGASAAQFLMISPRSRDLVAGGVSHSASLSYNSFPQDGRVKHNSMKIIRSLGCERETSQEMLYCLQQQDAFDIVEASFPIVADPINLNLALVVEPDEAEDAFITEVISANMSDKPWINTVATIEEQAMVNAMVFAPQVIEEAYQDIDKHVTDWLSKWFEDPYLVGEKKNKVMARYFAKQEPIRDFMWSLAKMYYDPEILYASIHNSLQHNGPVWMGYLEYKNEQSPYPPYPFNFAHHAEQLELYFNQTGGFRTTPKASLRDAIVSRRLIRTLANFAHYLQPTPPGSSKDWPQYRGKEIMRTTFESDMLSDQRTIDGLMDIYRFWDDILGWRTQLPCCNSRKAHV